MVKETKATGLIRNCDICTNAGETTPATVDAKIKHGGSWAYMCDYHNGVLGTGQKGLTTILSEIGNGAKEKV